MKEEITTRKRTEAIMIRVYPDDYETINQLAEQKGIPPATYCYLIVKEALDANAGK